MTPARQTFTGRLSALVAWLVLPGLLLLGAPPASAAKRESAEVKLDFWHPLVWEPLRTELHKLVDQFNREHPRIHVDILDVPQIEQKMLTAIVGKVPPDAAIFDRFRIAGYADRGAFMGLDELVTGTSIRREDFFEAPWDENIYEGKLYGIPFNTDVRVLYYNKKLFREAGLDPERPPRTWAELREYSRILTRRDARGELTQVGFVPYINFGNTWLYLYAWQKGATLMSDDGTRAELDDPRIVEALTWLRDFTADYGVSRLRSFQSGFATRELDPFLIGRMAMLGEEVFLLSRIQRFAPDLEYGVAPLPWPEDGERATWSGGFALTIPTGSPHPTEVMEFYSYLVGKAAQQQFGENAGQMPANRTATESSYYQDSEAWRVLISEMEYSRFRPSTPVGGIMWDSMMRAWEQGAAGVVSPEDAMKRAQRDVQAELDRLARRDSYTPVNWSNVTAIFVTGSLLLLATWIYSIVRRIRALSLHRSEAVAGYGFALPVILGLLIFWVGPILVAGVYSFSDYDILTPARWNGISNYTTLLTEDPLFWKSLCNTIFFTVFSVPTSLAGALGLALLLNANIKGKSLWRTLFYLPSIVPLVAMSLLFLWLFNGQFGLFNVILEGVGIGKVPWLTDPNVAKPSLVLMNMWGVGAGMIIFLAGLQGVPRHLHESAVIDGANVFQRFVNVTLPMLSPTIFFMLIINIIGAFQVFTQAYLMTNGTGSPEDSTLFYVFYLFVQGFINFNMGLASAMAWLMFIIILVATGFQFWLAKYWVYSEGGR